MNDTDDCYYYGCCYDYYYYYCDYDDYCYDDCSDSWVLRRCFHPQLAGVSIHGGCTDYRPGRGVTEN